MVSLPRVDLSRAVQLFQKHDPRKLMRKRHTAHGQALLRTGQYAFVQPQRSADHKYDIASAGDKQIV